MNRPIALLALLLAALGSLALGVSPAAAHASLISSDPGDGATVDRAPRTVTLTFSEPVGDPAFVAVTSGDGTDVTTGAPAIDGAVVTQRLDADAAGDYTIAYRVVSADGHPIEDELTFTARDAVEPAPSATPSDAESPAADEAPDDAGAESEATEPEATEADTEPAAQQTTADEGFWARNGVVVAIGLGVAAAVLALLLVARRRGQT